MTDDRKSFWDPAKRAAYLARGAEKSREVRRRKDGEDTAADLDPIWRGLTEPEKEIIRALLLVGKEGLVAPHDDPRLRGLIAKGLLRYPRGHGGAWMRAARTSYSIAPAVWSHLMNRAQHFLVRGTMGNAAALASAEALLKRVISTPWA